VGQPRPRVSGRHAGRDSLHSTTVAVAGPDPAGPVRVALAAEGRCGREARRHGPGVV
jgi:hypothetical protein